MANNIATMTNINVMSDEQYSDINPVDSELYFTPAEDINNMITNCITKLPQRINIELNDGTLTLKAGSVVIIPNGFEDDGTTKKFDYATIEEDVISNSIGTSSINRSLFVNPNLIEFNSMGDGYFFAGNTAPTSFSSGYAGWYDTANNLVKYTSNSGATWSSGYSFPVSRVYFQSGVPTDIKNVFNGIGYIGNVYWVDKDTTVLIPNGKNPDGTLKNIEYTLPRCITSQYTFAGPEKRMIVITTYNPYTSLTGRTIVGNDSEKPTTVVGTAQHFYYAIDTNRVYITSGSATANWIPIYACLTGIVLDVENSIFTNIKNVSCTNILHNGDRYWLSGLSMPSSTKVKDLTLSASGGNYVAPANGWFVLGKKSSGSGQYMSMYVSSNQIQTAILSTGNGQNLAAYLPVQGNATVNITYTLGGDTTRFRFIYAKGDN